MVATFSWVEYNLTAGDTGVAANLNLGSTNARDLTPSLYPITAGTYSFSKWVRAHFGGTFAKVDNLQFWMSASGSGYVTGETLWCTPTTTSYGGTSTYATPTTSADGQASNAMPTADPAAANMGITGSLTGSLTATGDSDYIVIQASITSAASAGAVQQKTFTIQYDET